MSFLTQLCRRWFGQKRTETSGFPAATVSRPFPRGFQLTTAATARLWQSAAITLPKLSSAAVSTAAAVPATALSATAAVFSPAAAVCSKTAAVSPETAAVCPAAASAAISRRRANRIHSEG